MKTPCPPGHVTNPLTNRCIAADGTLAKSDAVQYRLAKTPVPASTRCLPFKHCVGSRLQVWNGTARRTSGRLYRQDLYQNPKSGRIVSKKKHDTGRKLYARYTPTPLPTWDQKNAHYEQTRKMLGLSSVWSIYTVPDLFGAHPYVHARQVIYRSPYTPVTVDIPGATWADLYRAADRAIRLSGDVHHMFIERFVATTKHTLELKTGS